MRRNAFSLALAAIVAAVLPGTASADTPVDLELVLAVDISRSMDADELQVQRDGYVKALTHPDIIAAITHGPHKKIALSYVEWAGPAMQFVALGWLLFVGVAVVLFFVVVLVLVLFLV